jgi:5-methylcytosine-specific restriction endonuclease McrA
MWYACPMDTRICLSCGEEFLAPDTDRSKYCSNDCRYDSRRSYPKFSDEALAGAVRKATSWTEVCEFAAGIPRTSSLHIKIRKRCAELGIDTSHLLYPEGRKSPATVTKGRTLAGMLASTTTRSGELRKRLIRDGVREAKCERCGIESWNELPAPLELHHVDGNHSNNSLENLQILCCNCHAQTDSWRKPFTKRARRKSATSSQDT